MADRIINKIFVANDTEIEQLKIYCWNETKPQISTSKRVLSLIDNLKHNMNVNKWNAISYCYINLGFILKASAS